MANKKEESKTPSSSKKPIDSVPEEVLVNLPEREKAAIQEMESAPKGSGKSYRLKDPDTQYVDIETGWTLAGEQSKPLPENYSFETVARIKEGFLVDGSE